jgi:hypothetical protein
MDWANICYTSLVLLSMVLVIFTLIKTKDWTLIPLLFLISGMIFFGEYLVLFIFQGYIYKVSYFKEAYYNDYTGHIISNVFALPAVAIFIAGFSLKFHKILWIVLFFIGLEWIFIKLNIYEHRWWNFYFTGIALTIVFTLAKGWKHYLENPSGRWIMRLGYLCILFCLHIILCEFPLIVVFEKIRYSPGWFENPFRDSGVFYPLVGVTKAFISTVLLVLVNSRLIAAALILIANTLFYIALLHLDILHFQGINIFGLLIIEMIILGLVSLMEKFIIRLKLT